MTKPLFVMLLGSNWAVFLWKYYLLYRQYNFHRSMEERPKELEEMITDEEYLKAREYSLDKHKYFFAHELFNQIWTTIFFSSGWLPWLWGVTSACPIQSVTFVALKLLIDSLINLPWDMYKNFGIEEKYGFNKQTFGFYLKDQFKRFLLVMIILSGLLAVTMVIIENTGPHFYIFVWVVVSVLGFVFYQIYPFVIAPLFDEFVPLPDGELKVALEKQAASLNFPLKKLLVVIGSKRSAHSNAYMYGIGQNKRIVLYDTILSKEERAKIQKVRGEAVGETDSTEARGMTNNEVLAVLGHELGHWALNHMTIYLILLDINLLLMLLVFGYWYKWKLLYEGFGFSGRPIVIGIVLVYTFVLGPYIEVAKTIFMVISRRCEFAADHFSAELGYSDVLVTSLKKLGKDNLHVPVDDPLYSMCNSSHPTLVERIAELRKTD